MQIQLRCAACGTRHAVGGADMGGRTECPQCRAPMEVPRTDFAQGTRIAGYEILRSLGKGGMGEVYLARQLAMGREVALKILSAEFAAQPGAVERFLQEVRVAAKLDHPHVVTAHDAGEDDGLYYMAMSYVPGRSLEAILAPGVALAERDALVMARKLALALDHAWTRFRIIHRDITPANVLIDTDGEPRLVDMGLSKSPGDAEGTPGSDDIMGTPNYMSPEQAEGRADLDLRADVYSLGATLYHAVTGRAPYGDGEGEEILRRMSAEELPDPRSLNPQVSQSCASLLRIMLARSREDRYADWKALVRDIDFVLESKSPSLAAAHGGSHPTQKRIVIHKDGLAPHGPAAAAPRKGPPASSRPRALVLAGAGVLVLAAVAAVWVMRQGGGRTAAGPGPQVPQDDRAAAEREQAAVWQAAIAFAAANTGAPDRVIAGFEDAGRRLAGTRFEPMAKGEAERCRAAWTAEVERTFGELEARAQERVDRKEFDAAAGVFAEYAGPHAEALAERRAAAERLCRDLGRAATEMQAEAERTARDGERLALESAADAVCAGDPARALQACRAFLENAAAGDTSTVRQVAGMIEAAAGADRALLTTFEAQKGKEVVLASGAAKVPVRILDVRGGRVMIEQRKGVGWASAELTLSQIPAEERQARLSGSLDPAALGLWNGMAFLRARRPDLAGEAFKAAGGLSTMLVARTEGVLAGERETAAQGAFVQVLQMVGLPTPPPSPEALADVVQPGKVAVAQASAALRRLEAYSESFSDTRHAQSNAVTVAALRSALQTAQDPARPKPKPKVPQAGDAAVIDLGGGAALELAWVPPGEFVMGSPAEEFGRLEDEPQHTVILSKGFWMGRYEVTQLQYRQVMGDNPSHFTELGSNAPVEFVSWKDAARFCEKLGAHLPEGMRGMTARLPTEAEWEYACRAGTRTPLNNGKAMAVTARQDENLGEVAWYKGNAGGSPHPVGQRKPNEWGIHDMHGNVREWCSDWYGTYPAETVTDPPGPPGAPFRVLRGGGWDHLPRECRSANRYARPPEFRISRVGFRVVVAP